MPARARSKDFFVRSPRHLCNLCPGHRASCPRRAIGLTFRVGTTGESCRPSGSSSVGHSQSLTPETGRGDPMRTKVSWKPLGHSAKRWQGITLRKDSTATLRHIRPPTKKGWTQVQMWK